MSSIRRSHSPITTILTVVTSLVVSALVALALSNWVPWFSNDKADASSSAPASAPAEPKQTPAPGLKPYQGDGFTISLPETPTVKTQPVPTATGTLNMNLLVVDQKSSAWTISYMDLPEGATFDLDAGVKGSAANVGGTIAQSIPGKLAGAPSRDAQIVGVTKYGPEATVWGTYALVGNRVYMILRVGEGKSAPKPAEFDQVRQSFKLTKTIA